MANMHSSESELKDQTRYMANLIKYVSQPMIVTSADRHLLRWNSAFAKLTGYNNKELSDPIISAGLTAPEWHEIESKALDKLQRTGKSQTFQKEYIRKDGSRVPVEILIYRLTEDDGKVQYYIGLIADITERKRLEEALQKSERHYRVLVDNAIEGVVVIQNGDIKFVNPVVSLATGYSTEELLTMSLNDFLCPDNEKAAVESISKTVAPGTLLVVPLVKIRTKTGDTRLIESTVVSIIWDDEPANLNLLRDITERYESDLMLKESENKYRSILEDISEGYWEVDLAGNLTSFNEAICRIIGYSAEELRDTNYRAYTSLDDVDKVYEAFNQVFRTGNPIRNMHYQIVRKDGSCKFAETSVFPKHDDKNKITGFRGVSHDITERKQMEEALKESAEKYRAILEGMEESYYEVDLTGHLTLVNDALCRHLGYTREELIGMSYKVYVPPDEREGIFKAYNQIYRTGNPIILFRTKETRKDGSEITSELSILPLRNEQGEIIGFRGVGRDVSEQVQMEEALRQSEETYRTILDDIEEGYYETDLEGNYTFFNDVICTKLGYSREELMGKSFTIHTRPEDVNTIYEAYYGVYTSGKPLKWYAPPQIRKDGTLIYTDDSVSALRNKKGQIIGYRGISRDITERKRMEEALERSEEKYRNVLERMEEAYSEVDLAGNFTFFNDALCRHLGYSREELMGMNYKVYTAPDYVKKVYEAYNRVYRTGEPMRVFAIEEIKKDGTRMTAEISVSLLRNEAGEKIGFRELSRDVTERIAMEESLRRSEERYRTIMDEMHDDYFENDLDGNYIFVNDAFCRSVGYAPEEIIGKHYSIHNCKDDIERIYKAFNQVYRTGMPVRDITTTFIRKDGSLGAGEISAFPVRNDKGETIGFRGVSHDVTERKRMEEALRQSEQRYRTILEDMQESYFEVDLKGNYTLFNDAQCRQLGYTREEMAGLNYKSITPPDRHKEVFEIYNRIYRTGEPNDLFLAEQIKKDGTRIPVEYSAFPIRNEAGEIVGFRGVGRDISKRVQIEEALRWSEERYRTVLDDMEEAYYEEDIAGNFTYFNDALCRQLGYSREELMGMSYKVYTAPEDVPRVVETFGRIYRTGEPLRAFPMDRIRKDGKHIYTETSGFPLRDEKGQIIGFRGVIRDISERKKAEEEKRELEQKAQFASRLASVGELASGVAHEINNPLTGVIGYAHLLLGKKEISKDVRHDLEIINEGAQRVASIVKKLLAFARQTKPEQRYVNVNELIRNTLDLRAYELSANNIKVTLQLTRDMPLTIADPGQLQQVFLNLIINAETEMKLAHDKGRLSIKTERINSTIRITFKDTGPGIAEENLRTIFDPFFTTREVGQGTGLGLSVCHGIITEHNGKIWAESEPGQGAAFIIELPLTTEEGQIEPPEPAVEKPARGTKARILVVDDESVIRQFMRQVLTEQGHIVETIDNAASALKMVKAKRYRLILLDIKMPGMNGVELYKEFQKIAPSLTKRVVFITGDVMGKRTISFLNKTKTPYMMKPFDAKELKTEINRILGKK
jgi:PAS domain S-box-containing protein